MAVGCGYQILKVGRLVGDNFNKGRPEDHLCSSMGLHEDILQEQTPSWARDFHGY